MSQDKAGAMGLLSIQVWTDDGQFRARVRLTTDLTRPHEGVSIATSPDQVQAIVAAWLGMLMPASASKPTGSSRE